MSNNYMDSIYNLINSEEVEYNDDDIIYLDEPDDEIFYGYDDELAWADDITYLDEPYEDEFDISNLGEGFIPLPQGDYQEEMVVIDEHYVLDEYEEDLIANYERPAIETKQDIDYIFHLMNNLYLV